MKPFDRGHVIIPGHSMWLNSNVTSYMYVYTQRVASQCLKIGVHYEPENVHKAEVFTDGCMTVMTTGNHAKFIPLPTDTDYFNCQSSAWGRGFCIPDDEYSCTWRRQMVPPYKSDNRK